MLARSQSISPSASVHVWMLACVGSRRSLMFLGSLRWFLCASAGGPRTYTPDSLKWTLLYSCFKHLDLRLLHKTNEAPLEFACCWLAGIFTRILTCVCSVRLRSLTPELPTSITCQDGLRRHYRSKYIETSLPEYRGHLSMETTIKNSKGLERQRLIGSTVAGFNQARTITNASPQGLDAR